MSGALSALRPVIDTSEIENLDEVGKNPGHAKNLVIFKNMARKKRYKLSKILKDLTRNRNMGINVATKLFPKGKNKRQSGTNGRTGTAQTKSEDNSRKPSQMAWIN